MLVAYLIWVTRLRRRGRGVLLHFRLPGPLLTLGQTTLGVIDVCAAAGALYVLLPSGQGVGFLAFAALYSFAAMLGIASHSPGGLGVFEATMIKGVGGSPDQLLAALLLFRVIYYIVPFLLAMALLGAHEAVRRWRSLSEAIERAQTRGRLSRSAAELEAWARAKILRRNSDRAIPRAGRREADRRHPIARHPRRRRGRASNSPTRRRATCCRRLRIGELLVLALRAPDVIDAIRRVAAGGEAETALWSERAPIERLFQVDVAPIATDAGDVVAMLLTLRDLTEARRVERMRVDFIANASHELRTPLASLLGFIETLQGSAQADAKARDKFLAIMREQGRRMARLIDDLLSLSRIEQKQHVRPEAEVDLAQVVRHVADTLAPLAREMGVELKLDAETPVIVIGERDELVRVAENLIENAIKYGAHGAEARWRRAVEIIGHAQGKGRRARRARPRPRHRARASAAPDRTILSHRSRPEPRQERHRAGAGDRQAHPRAPSRPADHREPARRRLDVHAFAPLAASARSPAKRPTAREKLMNIQSCRAVNQIVMYLSYEDTRRRPIRPSAAAAGRTAAASEPDNLQRLACS